MAGIPTDLKKQITNDWISLFPDMGTYKPLWLMKRYGPVLIGICLEEIWGGKAYRPLVHIYNLCKESPAVTFSLVHRLLAPNNSEDNVQVLIHSERYKNAAERLEQQTVVPLRKDLSVEDVIDIYNKYLSRCEKANDPTVHTVKTKAYEDILLLETWSGKPYDQIKSKLDSYKTEMHGWPQRALMRLGDENGLHGWYERMHKIINQRDKIQLTVENELVKHKLQKIPWKNLGLD